MAALLVVAAGAYTAGVRRLAARGRRWRSARALWFATGLAVVALASMSGLAACEAERLDLHAVQHTLLSIVGPLLLVAGAPITLALQASGRSWQRTLVDLLHQPTLRILAHPVVSGGLLTASIFALYLTPLLGASLERPVLHAAVHLHMLAFGLLFVGAVVAVDPVPTPGGFALRLLAAALMIPFHGIAGVALMGSDHLLAPAYYSLADQRAGGAALWAMGDLAGLAVLGAVVVRWVRAELRAEARRPAEEVAPTG